MSSIYSKYLSINESKSVERKTFSFKKKLLESDEDVLKVLKQVYDENELKELKDGVSLKYNKKEKSYIVKTDGGAEYSLNTDNLDDALMKFYKKEILSDSEAKRYFQFLKRSLGESLKRKYLKESDKYWEAYEQAKKIIKDANVPEVYVDDVWEHSEFFMFVMGSDEEDKEKIIKEAYKKISSTFLDNKGKYPLINSVMPPFGKDDLSITFFIKEEAFLKDLKESKKSSSLNKRISESLKIKSFKEYKKLKETKFRKMNESSVNIKMDDGEYYECLWALFDSRGEKENDKYVEWYTDIGVDSGLSPNKIYNYVRYEATLATTEEVLSDVFDKSLDDFSNEEEAVQYILDNFGGSMDHKEIDGENLFLYVP